jgi:hypothetical protein
MAISTTDLADIERLLQAPATPATLVAELRRRFPSLSVTQCDPVDVDLETPFRSWQHVSLYLIDRADHCWRLTPDTALASGLLLVAQEAA